MKKERKRFFVLLISFAITIAIMIGVVMTLILLPLDSDLQLSLIFVFMIVMFAGVMWFSPKIQAQTENFQYAKLKENQAKPLTVERIPGTDTFKKRLVNLSFKVSYTDTDFTLYHRYTYDSKHYITKKPMLELMIDIHLPQVTFNHQNIVREVNRLENVYMSNKQKINNYTMLLIKSGETLTEDIKKACDDISFAKSKSRSIIAINAFYNTQNQTCYFLHNENYSPNIYYQHGVDLFKSILSK